MRMPRIAFIAVLALAVIACSEDASEPAEAEETTAPAGEFAQDAPPPPATGWGNDEGFAADDAALDPSFSEEQATSAEEVK